MLQRSFLILRHPSEASTCSMRVTPTSRFLATINSSKLTWSAVTALRPLRVATSSICYTRPPNFPRKNTLWRMAASASL